MYGIRNGSANEKGNNRIGEPNSSDDQKSQSDLAAQMGISVDTLQNYKILSEMIPELEELLDTGVITKYLITIQMNNLVRITYMCYAYFILLVGERKKMKELIDFIIKETPAHANEFLPDLKSLQNHIDNTQSALEKKMEKIDKKDFAKIGEYYTRIQELKDLKKKIQETEMCIEKSSESKSGKKVPVKNTDSKNTVKKGTVNHYRTQASASSNGNRTSVITGNNKNNKNSDDYRFRKDTYVVQSDPVNASLSRNMGTPSHVEYLHMAEGDRKRHKSRCIEYDKRSATCRCVKSPYYTSRCGGSSHCQYYKEKSSIM